MIPPGSTVSKVFSLFRSCRVSTLIFVALLGLTASAHAQTPVPAIWSMYYGNDGYQFVSQSADGNGNALLQYTTYTGGSATLTWNPNTNAFVSVRFTPPSTTDAAIYTSVGSEGSLIKSGLGLNNLQSIGAANYLTEGNFATASAPYDLFFNTFTYGSETYTETSSWMDMLGTGHHHYQGNLNGNAQGQSGPLGFSGLQITSATGLVASYVPAGPLTVAFSTSDSTGTNALASVQGMSLEQNGINLNVPAFCRTFTYNSQLYSIVSVNWNFEECQSYNYTAADGGTGDILWNGSAVRGFFITPAQGQSVYYGDGADYGRPNTLYYDPSNVGPILLTACDAIQYTIDGQFLVPSTLMPTPVSPVKNFQYGGENYKLNGTGAWSNGQAVYQFHSANGGLGSVSWDPVTQAITALTVNPHAGGSASYSYDSASKSYTLQSGSTAADGSAATNSLNRVNNVAYIINGNTSIAPASTSDQGDMIVQGNNFILGLWNGDSTHAGMAMSYLDGGTDFETDVLLSASRPSTDWLWEHPSTDGQSTLVSMELDPSHKLQLYPLDQTPTASGVIPTIVLDPNNAVRFDVPVRIKPQGDLEMGEFTSDPTSTPAQ